MMKILILHLLVWGLSSAATAGEVKLHYMVYWAGLSVVDMEVVIDIEDTKYHVSNEYRSKGILNIFSKFKNQASVSGVMDAQAVPQPEFHRVSGTWSGKSYDHQVTFDPASGKVLSRKIINEDKDWEREDVAEELKVSPDPMTLLFRMLLNKKGEISPLFEQEEMKKDQVYDGSMVAEYQHYCREKTDLKKTKKSIFSGEAIRCDFGFKFIDGELKKKPKKKKKKKHKRDDNIKIWVSEWPDLPYLIPVRAEFPATFGKAWMYLTKVE